MIANKASRGALAAALFVAAAPAFAADADAPAFRDDIIVTGQRSASVATSGTKTDTPLVETPQSISVISRYDLDVRGIVNLNQALRYTAGITPETRGANAEVYDQFTLRGFTVPRYLDGLRVFTSPTGYADQQVDTSRIDRIEVVKGPASVLYGQSSPGGLVALGSKLPGESGSYGGVEATYGTFDLYRFDADVGGAANESGSVLYRVYGSVNGADTQQTFGKRRRYTGSAAVTLGAGSDTTLTLLGNYSHDPYNGNYGSSPLYGTLRPNPNGRVRQDFADGDPSLTRIRRNQAAGSYFLTHSFGDTWVARANGRYTDITANFLAPYQFGYFTDAAQRVTPRGVYGSDEHLKSWVLDHQLAGKVRTGALTHDLLFGVDYQHLKSNQDTGFDAAPGINVFAPVYNIAFPTIALANTNDVRASQVGLYAQDQLSLGGFRLTASGRYDFSRQRLDTNFSNDRVRNEKFTYRVGGLYLTDVGIAPYASYSTSFEPNNSRVLQDDGTIGLGKPTLGKQIEAGVKYQPSGTPILITAAYFRINQTNVSVSNPVTFVSIQSGKVRSEGFEVEAKVPLFAGFNLTAEYTIQKVRTREDVNPANVGRPLIGVGREKASLFADYTVQQGPLEGVGIGGGVRHLGSVYSGFRNTVANPDYVYTRPFTLFDAVLSYDLSKLSTRMEGMRLAVNAANVFNKRNVTSCYVNFFEWCWYGQRRTVQATLGYRW